MANAKSNGERYKYAKIDTAPAAAGYWCDSVSMSKVNAKSLFISVWGGGSATVTIQFKTADPVNGAWTDYSTDETIEDGSRFILEDWAAGVKWRVGVKSGGYSSGTVWVGIDW